MYSN
jgi:hypothetical protein